MTTKRDVRRVRLSETRSSWEDQGGSEVAAGKLEVMEKFFTPVSHSAVHRSAKVGRKDGSSSDGMLDPYYTESFSSSPSSSSSTWSSESNFDRRFSGYHARATFSRSCNDLFVGKGSRNDDERRNYSGKQNASLGLKRGVRDSTEKLNTGVRRVGSTKVKGPLAQSKDVRPKDNHGILDKRTVKDGSRRARSMEVLAQKEPKKGEGKKKATEEKKRFSQFLDEITVQVLSPSNLTSLGVKERQTLGVREQWKTSSTDSSGSRGKRTHLVSIGDRQELRRKGKATMEAIPKSKVSVTAPDPRRSRDLSTSPDSASSSALPRGRGGSSSPRASAVSHKLTGPETCGPLGLSKERNMSKCGSQFDPVEREKKDNGSKGKGLQEKAQYADKSRNRFVNEASLDTTAQAPIIPPPDWWGDVDNPEKSQSSEKTIESRADTFRSTSGTQFPRHLQENDLYSIVQNENLGADKDSLNKKITELLEHLVRAQSTICALEKLNVSSLLSHLPPDTLKEVKGCHKFPDDNSQLEAQRDISTATGISPEVCLQDTRGSDVKQATVEDIVVAQTTPRLTAFTPWSPRRARTLSTLHQLYNSTESECSLDDILPTCKLLSPRFPYLGESFSDDRKDQSSAEGINTRAEQRVPGEVKPSLTAPSLLPTHRIPPCSHRTEVSSSESSGDDTLLLWGQAPFQGTTLDYISAQKILDTLLGITSSNMFPSMQSDVLSNDSIAKAQLLDHIGANPSLPSHPEGNKDVLRVNPKPGSHLELNKDDLNFSGQFAHSEKYTCVSPNPLHIPKENLSSRPHHSGSKIPPLPVKRSPHTFNHPSNVDNAGFNQVGKQEGAGIHSTEALYPLSNSTPGYSSDPLCHHSVTPFTLRNPSGGDIIMSSWEEHDSCQNPRLEMGLERKPRKERMVHFNMQNSEGQVREGQKSKLIASRGGDQRSCDNTLVDSTLL